MKYLNKRNEFLKSTTYKVVNEDSFYSDVNSGPFANNIGWHDSLVGRLMDNMIRKAKIATGVNRMKPLVKRLEQEFDRMNAEGAATALNTEDSLILLRTKLYSLFYNLTEAVKKGIKVGIIRSLTNTAIKDLNSMEEFEQKEALRKELDEFKKFLEQFKDDEGLDEEEAESKTEADKSGIYFEMVKNLKSLSLILTNYEKVKINKVKQLDSISKITYKTVEGDTLNKIKSNLKINIKGLNIEDIRKKNSKILASIKDDAILKPGLLLIMESDKFGTGGGENRSNLTSNEDHLTQAYLKLKRDIEILKSSKDKGVSIDINFINDIISNSNDSKNKTIIKSLYNEIKRYLVGDKKDTLQEKDALYKESIEVISDINKRNVVAEKIARFSKRAIQFKGTGLESGLGDLKKPLQDFISSLDIIIKYKTEENDPKSEVEVKERTLLRYNNFNLIKEGEENRITSDVEVKTTSSKIRDYYDLKCKGVKAFVVEKTEVDKIIKNLDLKQKEIKDKNFIIDGMDPIIEICKLFNRAFKLYIVRNRRSITKRTDPQYSSAFLEYTALGGENGPWRNNKIFDIWEDAVYKIMGDKKYQHIFLPSTKLRIPKVPNPKGSDDYEYRERAGANLRKFMTDLLDGDDLYKVSSGKDRGEQNQFLSKYFGEPDEATKSEVKASGLGYPGDEENNAKLVEDISESEIKLKFSATAKIDKLKERVFLLIDGTNSEGKEVQRTFFISDITSGWVYLSYCTTFGHYNRYLDKLPNRKKIDKGDFPRLLTIRDPKYKMKYTKIKADEFKNLLLNNEISIKNIDGRKEITDEKINIKKHYWLVLEENNTLYQIDSDNELKEVITSIGDKYDIKAFLSGIEDSESIKIVKS